MNKCFFLFDNFEERKNCGKEPKCGLNDAKYVFFDGFAIFYVTHAQTISFYRYSSVTKKMCIKLYSVGGCNKDNHNITLKGYNEGKGKKNKIRKKKQKIIMS